MAGAAVAMLLSDPENRKKLMKAVGEWKETGEEKIRQLKGSKKLINRTKNSLEEEKEEAEQRISRKTGKKK